MPPPTGGRGTAGRIILSAIISINGTLTANFGITIGFDISSDNGATWQDMATAYGVSNFVYFLNSATLNSTYAHPFPCLTTLGTNSLYPINATATYKFRCKVTSNTASSTLVASVNFTVQDSYK
jgi:hypothetical protein